MDSKPSSFVSVVTPVYNGANFLAQCAESVLAQTYQTWEFLIVDNCSTDSTLEIARKYEAQDKRIRVVHYDEFLDVIGSCSRALGLISPHSEYCKIVAADDWMFPECLAQMVALAEANPSVGIIGAYTLSGGGDQWRLKFDGLSPHKTVVSGREACRWHLLGGVHYFGYPSSVLYRSELVRPPRSFYPNQRGHADISAFYECLGDCDFGFVHQVLTCESIHEAAGGAEAKRIWSDIGCHLLDVLRYGPALLTDDELTRRVKQVSRQYYRVLAFSLFQFKGKKFWDYHRAILKEAGYSLYGKGMMAAVLSKIADLFLNPKQTVERIFRRFSPLSPGGQS